MKTLLADSNIYPLKGTQERFFHLGTLHRSVREFVCFIDKMTSMVYIYEMTGATLTWIGDQEELYSELEQVVFENKLADPFRFLNYLQENNYDLPEHFEPLDEEPTL